MIIDTFNIDNLLKSWLSKDFTVISTKERQNIAINASDTQLDALIIDWIPSEWPGKEKQLIDQTKLVEKYIKKNKKVIIFDRYLGITVNEFKWFTKRNVVLFEPALNYRSGFTYMPFPVKIKNINDDFITKEKRKYDLIYKGNLTDKTKWFENYYIEFKKKYPEKIVSYDAIIDRECGQKYKTFDVIENKISYIDAKSTIIIGSKQEYNIGYLNQGFVEALALDCLPLIPAEHRYYNGMITVNNINEAELYTSLYDELDIGLLIDCHDRIKKYYPEMMIEYAVDMIKFFIK